MQLVNATTGTVIGEKVELADTFLKRLRGLLGRAGLEPGEGLVIAPCSSIHSIGMRFSFDAVFLDSEKKVIRIAQRIPPNRLGPVVPKARYTVELPAGTVEKTGIEVGHTLHWSPEKAF